MCFRALSLSLVSLGLFALAAPNPGLAVTTVTQSGHLIRIWQTEDGLPQNTVMAITQDRNGYLWVGTLGGLSRFDGLHFQTFDVANTPSFRDERITSLFEDTRGTLWIGHDSGDVTCYRDGRFEAFSKGSGPGESVYAITEDDRGKVWLFRQDGVLECVDHTAPVTPPSDSSPKMLSLARSPTGRIWIRVEGKTAELKAGIIQPLNFGPAHYTDFVRGLCAANDGGLWVVRDQRIGKWMDGHWTDDRGPWGNSDISAMCELRNGTVAVGTLESGLRLFYPNGRTLTFDYNHGSIQNWVRLLYEDREGNLWIAAGSGGLAMVRPTAFSALNPPDNWQGRTVLAVTPAKDGALWIGTEGAGVYRYHESKWTHYGEAEGFTNPYIWSVATDAAGGVWAGTWSGRIFRLEGERFVPATELEPVGTPVRALQTDSTTHALWAGTGNGLLQWKDGGKFWHGRLPGQPAIVVYAMDRDARGALWLALGDAGVGQLTASGLTRFVWTDAATTNSAQCLLTDGDVLWVGTLNGGLKRLKNGRYSTVSVEQGLASRVICHIEDDGAGYLWLSTHRGILRVSKRELNRCADGEISTVVSKAFDKDDGLPTLEYSGGLQGSGCHTSDGRLWFTSNKGLVSVDPRALPLNTLAPPVVVESMWVDGRALEHGGPAQSKLKLPPSHERMEFRYTALSFSAPSKVLFKYRLEGLDNRWIEAGDKRAASYSHLPPGNYSFHVIACNNDGVWNTQGDSLDFAVAPFYWQTWWFRILAVLLAIAGVGSIVRYETRRRMQHRLDELEHERGIERERSRIAQDIHDDIGTSLTRITMLSQTVRTDLDQPARVASVLERIHDTALDVTHTLDEIVWAVDPRHDNLDSLVCYISRLAQETLADAGIACRIDLPMNLPPWPLKSQVRHNLLLAFKEVLNNILKHAHATEAHVFLVVQESTFVITVQDNGTGHDFQSAETTVSGRALGGNGLENVRRRLAQIGGHCEMRASSTQGWCVVFTVAAGSSGPARTSSTPASVETIANDDTTIPSSTS
ncbi:MAG TPA: two-component regulator propeller domain-containing protein [Lacunisphaera sp.]|jgi:ligand-binding sensor domain-containing protein/signal transduction histidine kinase